MSLFDKISGKGDGKPKKKVGLPKNAKLADVPQPAPEQPAEPVAVPAEASPTQPFAAVEAYAPAPVPEPEATPVAPEPAPVAPEPTRVAEPQPAVTPEPEPVAPEPEPAPVREKVEGWEDEPPTTFEPVVPAEAVPETADAPDASVAAAAAIGAAAVVESKKRRARKSEPSKVVGLSGEHRRKAARPERAAKAARKEPRPESERKRIDILGGFRDPKRRPRLILQSGAALLVFAAFMIVVLGITSTRWFCAEGCHKVQDDTITAYRHSSHSEISCMACHMPVGSNPVVFLLHKAEALGELYLTATNKYELPLNGESEVALTMKSSQCTQCHDMALRKATPSAGIIIDHNVHAEKGVDCTICHNRIAHKEDFTPVLTDPASGEPNRKHEEFSSMTACFRCHTQETKSDSPLKAPGTCITCHPKDFKLKPASHLQPGFFPKGHGKLGKEAAARVASATAEPGAEGESGVVPASNEKHGEGSLGESLPKVGTINECHTCHAEKFCNDCHGAPMPHPADFKKNHGTYGKKSPEKCQKCHGRTDFCNECHHSKALNREYDKSTPWIHQHPDAVKQVGASTCLDCHKPTYCAKCHVSGSPAGSSGTPQ